MPDSTKLSLAKESFKNVLDSDIHLDNKASRVLAAMAFLTAAAAAIFARFFPNTSNLPIIKLLGVDWVLVSFSGFILLILIGVLLYMAALGPSLNTDHFGEKKDIVKSRLFFDAIGVLKQETWKKVWDADADVAALESQMIDDFVTETFLIAQKTRTKHFFMSWGSVFLKLAVLCLCFLISNFFSYNLSLVRLFVVISAILVNLVLLIENRARPSKKNQRLWMLVPLDVLIGAIVIALA